MSNAFTQAISHANPAHHQKWIPWGYLQSWSLFNRWRYIIGASPHVKQATISDLVEFWTLILRQIVFRNMDPPLDYYYNMSLDPAGVLKCPLIVGRFDNNTWTKKAICLFNFAMPDETSTMRVMNFEKQTFTMCARYCIYNRVDNLYAATIVGDHAKLWRYNATESDMVSLWDDALVPDRIKGYRRCSNEAQSRELDEAFAQIIRHEALEPHVLSMSWQPAFHSGVRDYELARLLTVTFLYKQSVLDEPNGDWLVVYMQDGQLAKAWYSQWSISLDQQWLIHAGAMLKIAMDDRLRRIFWAPHFARQFMHS